VHHSDESDVQDDGVVLAVHVTPASCVTSTSTALDDVAALTMQSSESVHSMSVTVSPIDQVRGRFVDHDAPPSLVKERRVVSLIPVLRTTAQFADEKQLRARTA
jgi:hypothetical protein